MTMLTRSIGWRGFWVVWSTIFLIRDQTLYASWWRMAAVSMMAVCVVIWLGVWAYQNKTQEKQLWVLLANLTKSSLSLSRPRLYDPAYQTSLRENRQGLQFPYVSQSGNQYRLRYQEDPYVGFRVWRVVGGRLTALTRSVSWEVGINEARCIGAGAGFLRDHVSPEPDCSCGLYSYGVQDVASYQARIITPYSISGALSLDPGGNIVGAVCGWGVCLPHGTAGFRAQFAKVIALLDAGEGIPHQLARKYQVPLFSSTSGIMLYAKEYGETLKVKS